jgi:excisionase family DNA binding protein
MITFTTVQAAKYLGVTTDTIRNWAKSKKMIPFTNERGRKYYTQEQLDEKRKEHHEVAIITPPLDVQKTKQFFIDLCDKVLKNGDKKFKLQFSKNNYYPSVIISTITSNSLGGASLPWDEHQWGKEITNPQLTVIEAIEEIRNEEPEKLDNLTTEIIDKYKNGQ